MRHRTDPEGSRLPIKLDSTSNGEFASLTIPSARRAPTGNDSCDPASADARRLAAIPARGENRRLPRWTAPL